MRRGWRIALLALGTLVALGALALGTARAQEGNLLRPTGELSAWQTENGDGPPPTIEGAGDLLYVNAGEARGGQVFQIVSGLRPGRYTLQFQARAERPVRIDLLAGSVRRSVALSSGWRSFAQPLALPRAVAALRAPVFILPSGAAVQFRQVALWAGTVTKAPPSAPVAASAAHRPTTPKAASSAPRRPSAPVPTLAALAKQAPALLEEALRCAEDITGPASRAKALTAIGVALARAGDRAGARRRFSEATGAALQSFRRDETLRDVVEAGFREDDVASARETAAQVPADEPIRGRFLEDWLLETELNAALAGGDLARVKAALAKVPADRRSQAGILVGQRAAARTRNGDLSGARGLLELAPEGTSFAWAQLALACADAGDASGAQVAAERIAALKEGAAMQARLPALRSGAWASAARAQARAGHAGPARALLVRAEEGLAEMKAARDQIDLRCRIAEARAALGDTAGARALLGQVLEKVQADPSLDPEFWFREVAQATARCGDTLGARALLQQALEATLKKKGDFLFSLRLSELVQTAGTMGEMGIAGEALRQGDADYLRINLAKLQAQRGDLAGTWKTLDGVPEASDRVRALIEIAEERIAARQPAEGAIALQRALPLARAEERIDVRAESLARLAALMLSGRGR